MCSVSKPIYALIIFGYEAPRPETSALLLPSYFPLLNSGFLASAGHHQQNGNGQPDADDLPSWLFSKDLYI